MASDRSYRQLRNIQDEDVSDDENNAFSPLAGQHQQSEPRAEYRGQRSQKSGSRSCGKGRATCVVFVVLTLVLGIAVVSSFARPRCSRETGTTTNVYTTPIPQRTSNRSTRPPTPSAHPWPWSSTRLPRNIIPTAYDIFLHPNLTTYNVNGTVEIRADVVNPTSFIVIHKRNISITDVIVRVVNGSTKNIIGHQQYNADLEQLIIVLQNEIPKGVAVKIRLNFTYELKAGLQGFYRSTYKTDNGITKTIATTQFEPSDARAAFPCFDEPDFKATFALKMVREPQYHTLFNMPLAYTHTYDGNLEIDVFNSSVNMSTYLVAFVISEFQNITYQVRDNLTIGVHAASREIDEMELALKILNKTITFYEDYFGVQYPLPKQDMVAIPDFAAGAMENWGLITYRQVEVLYKPGTTTISQKQRIVIVIAHELAHQWFGNLVTMKWWNDLWLNEGFASFVEYVGTDNWNSSWNMMDQFILHATHPAMALDCLNSSHPISVKVERPDEINAVFDAISYDKGASILRMLEEHLGKAGFLEGIKNYLQKHSYLNAESNDLWNELSLSNINKTVDVKKMMDTWTIQKGYPVVKMLRNNTQIQVTQKQFFLKDGFIPEEKNMWIIPLSYITDTDNNYTVIIQNQEKSVSLTIDSSVKWFKGNIRQTGFYRVNYDVDNWIALSKQLNDSHTALVAADRASLIDDALYLARAGLLNYTVALDLVSYIDQEEDYVPILTALSHFRYIGVMLQKTADYTLYKKYMYRLIETWKGNLGWDEKDTDSHLTKLLRHSVLTEAVKVGHEKTINDALNIFKNWIENNVTLNENLKYPVYCAAARNGDNSYWEFLWNRYLTTNVVSEKKIVMSALACTRDISTIYRYLNNIFDGTVRLQDVSNVIGSIASHAPGAQPSWLFLQENWDNLLEMLGSTSFSFGNIISSCTSNIASSVEHEQAKSFFADRSNAGSGSRAIENALEKMDINVNWLTKNKNTVKNWLNSQL